MTSISLFASVSESERASTFNWEPSWSVDTQLQALKKYCGKKYVWVERNGRREHVSITIQVLLDRQESDRLANLESRYSQNLAE